MLAAHSDNREAVNHAVLEVGANIRVSSDRNLALLYLAAIYSLGILVSTRTQLASTSITVLLMVWVLVVLVVAIRRRPSGAHAHARVFMVIWALDFLVVIIMRLSKLVVAPSCAATLIFPS